MDDHHIGKHCSDTTCKQKDWLPIKCKYCQKFYCAQHYSIESHNCSEHAKTAKKVYSCPICNKVLTVNMNLSVEENFQIHEATQCSGVYEKKKQQVCPTRRCKTKLYEYNHYVCKGCSKKFCLKHRIQQDHQCILAN